MRISGAALDAAAAELALRDRINIPFEDMSSGDKRFYRSKVYAVLDSLSGVDNWEYFVTGDSK